MYSSFSRRLLSLTAALICTVCLGVPAFAQIPNTGDGSGMLLPIMGGLLVVSVVLIIVYIVMSKKKKK